MGGWAGGYKVPVSRFAFCKEKVNKEINKKVNNRLQDGKKKGKNQNKKGTLKRGR